MPSHRPFVRTATLLKQINSGSLMCLHSLRKRRHELRIKDSAFLLLHYFHALWNVWFFFYDVQAHITMSLRDNEWQIRIKPMSTAIEIALCTMNNHLVITKCGRNHHCNNNDANNVLKYFIDSFASCTKHTHIIFIDVWSINIEFFANYWSFLLLFTTHSHICPAYNLHFFLFVSPTVNDLE